MNKIINLEQVTDYEIYNPILTLSEDLDYDNRFCVIRTNAGNISFSYYDLGIAPDYIIQDVEENTWIIETKGGENVNGISKNIDIKVENKFAILNLYSAAVDTCKSFIPHSSYKLE